jgi:hypothetical protein
VHSPNKQVIISGDFFQKKIFFLTYWFFSVATFSNENGSDACGKILEEILDGGGEGEVDETGCLGAVVALLGGLARCRPSGLVCLRKGNVVEGLSRLLIECSDDALVFGVHVSGFIHMVLFFRFSLRANLCLSFRKMRSC